MAGNKGVGKFLTVFLRPLGDLLLITDIFTKNNLHCPFWSHDGDLRTGPGQIDVAAQVLGRHHIVGPTIGFSGNDRDLRHRAFCVGIKQFRAMSDNAAVFLRGSRQKARHINKGYDRNAEGITESDETRRLDRRLNVETPGEHHGLIGHDANG